MSTLKDVAQRAGVSSITVSRVINTPELVKEKTKDKVIYCCTLVRKESHRFVQNIFHCIED